MLSFNKFLEEETRLFNEECETLLEKLIVFKGGAKYGQIVFLSGGAGSGKGFAAKSFMEIDKFKVRDVDEWKLSFLKIAELKNKYPEIKGLDLKKGKDVAKLHFFVKNLGTKEKTLDLLLSDINQDRLPNIMFDITGKDISDFEDVIPQLIAAGYDSKNIHVAWILANWKASFKANLSRKRVVPADIFLGTHRGAAKTMSKLLAQKKMPKGADGSFHVIMNNRENTVFFEGFENLNESKAKVNNIKGFYYITPKREGRPWKPEEEWKDELFGQIANNIPGGEKALSNALINSI